MTEAAEQILLTKIAGLERLIGEMGSRLNEINHPMQPVFLAAKDGDKTWHEQSVIAGAVTDLPTPRRECGSSAAPSAAMRAATGSIMLEVRDASNFRYVEIIPANVLFLVSVAKSGGVDGDSTHFAQWAYNVFTRNGTQIGTNLPITGAGQRVVKASVNAGNTGMAAYDNTGNLSLIWVNETITQTNCE